MNGNLYDILTTPNTLIADLRPLIELQTGVPRHAQRLLFKAILLQPHRPLLHYGITSDQLINLVANRIPSERSSPSSVRLSDRPRTNALTQQNLLYKKHRYAQQRINGFHVTEAPDIVESLRQNAGTLQQLITCLNSLECSQSN